MESIVLLCLILKEVYRMKAKKLPSGNFRVQVVAGYDENGKRIVKSFTDSEEWRAIKRATDYLEDVKNIFNPNTTVAAAMERYIKSRRNVIEETTIHNYNQVLNLRFKSIMDVKICDLKPIQIQQAINADAEHVSPKTLKNAYGLLKSVLKMYEYDKNLSSIRLPKLKKNIKELPSFETLFAIVKGTSVELPVLLAAWLSLRIGEVLGLQFQDVDMKNKTIRIRRTMVMTDEGMKVRDGCKTENSVRELEIPDYIFHLIQRIPHETESDFLFTMSRKAMYSRFKRLMNRNGIDITFHDLRHLNASVMLMLGVPDKYAMERGGWATDNILKSVYQQTFSSERKKVDAIIDGYFNGIIMGTENAETA